MARPQCDTPLCLFSLAVWLTIIMDLPHGNRPVLASTILSVHASDRIGPNGYHQYNVKLLHQTTVHVNNHPSAYGYRPYNVKLLHQTTVHVKNHPSAYGYCPYNVKLLHQTVHYYSELSIHCFLKQIEKLE